MNIPDNPSSPFASNIYSVDGDIYSVGGGDDDSFNDDDSLSDDVSGTEFFTQPPNILYHHRNTLRRCIDNDDEFRHLNSLYYPTTEDNTVIPQYCHNTIALMLRCAWNVTEPRPYQIEAIFNLFYKKVEMMYLIQKTGEGKSMVLLGTASMLGGVVLSLVPLLGLGADQVNKCNQQYSGFEAYHIDEFRADHAATLMRRLSMYTYTQSSTIVLHISPGALQSTSSWYKLFCSLAERGAITMFCVDEAHSVVHNYESFRPEFKHAIQSINDHISISKSGGQRTRIPILVMSATFGTTDQQRFNELIGRLPTIVIWGPMDKRNVGLHVTVAADCLRAMQVEWSLRVASNPDSQSLIYSNSATQCEGSILNRLEQAYSELPEDIHHHVGPCEFHSFTGKCGVMFKTYLMDAFCYSHCSTNESNLPKLIAMPCTSAANCGVSSNSCDSCYRVGPPPNLYDLFQEMGRVNRGLNAEHRLHFYRIYVNVPSYLALWVRIQSEPDENVRMRKEQELADVMTFLFLPSSCYHVALEEYFQHPSTPPTSNSTCDDNCSFCCGDKFSSTIFKQQLINILTANLFHSGSMPATKLVSAMSSRSSAAIQLKRKIWCGNHSSVDTSDIHGLVLMLIASRMIIPTLDIKSGSNATMKNVLFTRGTEYQDSEQVLSLHVDEKWDLFRCTVD